MTLRVSILLIALIGLACDQLPSPPAPAPITVTTIVSGPAENAVLAVPVVTFRWVGTENALLFQYQIDNGAWSAWGTDDSVRFDYLDEGAHRFAVRSQHRNGITIEEHFPARNFTVDAVHGPAVMFQPRLKTVSAGAAFVYDIRAEEVTNLFAARLTFHFSPGAIRIDSVQAGDFVKSNGGRALQFPDLNTIDNINGLVTVNLVVTGGTPAGITGSGAIARLFGKGLTAQTDSLYFTSAVTSYRDTANAAIPIVQMVAGKLVVR